MEIQSSNNRTAAPQAQDQFIFQESEFEGAEFDAAEFVSRYRRVTSLDSLRDQLEACTESLKQQLFFLINKDYKDFIHIATKLDGVDTRIEFLRKPLVDLRLDLAALHDGLIASVQSIQDKLHRKSEISSRRLLLETILSCTEKLDVVENIINDIRNGSFTAPTKISRRQLLQMVNDEGKLIFMCSELERGAHSIKQVDLLLDKIQTSVSHGLGINGRHAFITNSAAGGNSVRTKELEALQRTLRQRSSHIFSSLVGEIQKLVVTMMPASAIATCFPRRAFCHCVRALLVLGRGDVLETVCDASVVAPLARSTLTQGRVDGSGGRGSYSGFQETLLELVTQLKGLLSDPINATEEQVACFAGSSNVDIVTNSIWKTVTAVLLERFPSMFTIAIPDSFARCYIAYDSFLQSLTNVGGECNCSDLLRRMSSNAMVAEVDNKWNMDVYFHLRSKEICQSVDQACEAALVSGITFNVFESSSLVSRLQTDGLASLQDKLSIGSYQLPLVKYFASEASMCVEPRIMLRPVRGRFLTLALRLFRRLEAHICAMSDITSTLINKSTLAAIQSALQSHSSDLSITANATPTKSISNSSSYTPLSSHGSSSSLNSTPAATPVPSVSTKITSTNPAIVTTEELVLLFVDLRNLQTWLQSAFKTVVVHQCDDSSQAVQITRLISTQAAGLESVRIGLWTKACGIVSGDCKKNLGGVRIIAGKYRMTNKPPPDSPSSYVETILQPLKAFRDRHGASVSSHLSEEGKGWELSIIEDVTLYFVQQVQSLMETVKQMDTALQRRTKARPTGAPATTASLSDSEKIALQVSLDIAAYGKDISALLAIDISSVEGFSALLLAAAESKALSTGS